MYTKMYEGFTDGGYKRLKNKENRKRNNKIFLYLYSIHTL